MKDVFGARYYLFLLAPYFFALFADFAYITISRTWYIIPYMLLMELSFYAVPIIVAARYFRKKLSSLSESARGKDGSTRLLARIPAILMSLVLFVGLAYSCVVFLLMTEVEGFQVYTYRWHFFVSMACSYLIMQVFLAWTFAGFWAESCRISFQRCLRITLPAGSSRISGQIVLVFLFVFTIPFLSLMLSVRAWVLNPYAYRSIFYSDLLSLHGHGGDRDRIHSKGHAADPIPRKGHG
jgi:hypothetical protein